MLADDTHEDVEHVELPPLSPTPTIRTPPIPPATPTTLPLDGPQPTAGTRRYGAPGDTPSTQRLHNPTRVGR